MGDVKQWAMDWLMGRRQPDYDMAGYVSKYGKPDQSRGQHLTDEFKLPSHMTFSTGSMYSTPEQQGGQWSKTPWGQWMYKPSDFVVKQQGMPALQSYFKTMEPNSLLIER